MESLKIHCINSVLENRRQCLYFCGYVSIRIFVEKDLAYFSYFLHSRSDLLLVAALKSVKYLPNSF